MSKDNQLTEYELEMFAFCLDRYYRNEKIRVLSIEEQKDMIIENQGGFLLDLSKYFDDETNPHHLSTTGDNMSEVE